MTLTLAADTFGRSLSSSWGSADIGGAWTLVNGSAAFSVGSGLGSVAMAASYDRQAYLNDVATTQAHIRVALQSDGAHNGGNQSWSIIGRQTPAGPYQARVRVEASSTIRLYIMRGETALVSSTTITHDYAPGEVIWVDLLVSGTDPTTVSAKMWLATDVEPGAYQQTATDSTAGYQVAGSVGIKMTLGAPAAAGVVMSVDNYLAEDPTASAAVAADPVGLTDAVTTVVNSVRTISETAAVIDLPGEQTLAISLPIDDTVGLSDAVTRMASAARSIADAASISDSAASSLSVVSAIADQAALTDSSAAATSAARGPAEAAGIGDQTAATLAVTRTPADQLGATDSVTVSITSAGDALVTDAVGAVDQITVSATSSRTIADGLALTDAATAILTAGAIPVEMIGLGDAVTAELTTTRDVSEAIGVVDQVAAFLLSRGEAADPAGIGDQVAAEIQRARQADDVTEVSDTLATLAVSVRTLTDAGTLTDVVTAVLAPSVAPLGRTLLVYYERRYRPGWTGTIDHDPQAKLDYTWDWTDWLGGDTIISATVTAKVEEARDPTDVVTIDDVWPSPKTITAWISGGVHGTPCAVTCRITTTAGRIDDRTIRLRVRDR